MYSFYKHCKGIKSLLFTTFSGLFFRPFTIIDIASPMNLSLVN